MRVLIVSVAIFACAAAAPSGLLAAPYSISSYAAPLAVAHAAPLAVAHAAPVVASLPINSGDLAGAAIDAHVEASDHARAAADSINQAHDQLSEIQGKAINHAEESSWSALNAVQSQAAAIDGAAAGASPVLAKQVAGHSAVAYSAPVAVAAPLAYSAPVAVSAPLAYSAPFAAAAHGYVSHAPVAYAHGW